MTKMTGRFFVLCLALAMVSADGLLSSLGKEIKKDVMAVATPIEETFVGISSSQCGHVKKIVGVAYSQIDGDKEPDLNKLTLEYRDRNSRIVYNIATAAENIVQSRGYDPARKLTIFVHGFTEDPSRNSFGTISDALLKAGDCNVLALDGSSLIRWLYLRSSTYVRFMGEKLGATLADMVKSGVDPASIHMIGHSLGAHISGFTGKTFHDLTGRKIGRVSGLDPAGPCFSHVNPELRLKATDADFVDVMHTDGGIYGLKEPLGQVDYYPNNGEQQPNCLLQTCSHNRAWVYYSESVVNPKAFPAVKCKDWEAFKKGDCDKGLSYMGYPSVPGTTGVYYLQTHDETPYGLGHQGTKYKNNEGIVKNLGHQTKKLLG